MLSVENPFKYIKLDTVHMIKKVIVPKLLKKHTHIQGVESLLGDIRHLHEHHVPAPHKGQNVENRVEMIDEDVLINVELPHAKG